MKYFYSVIILLLLNLTRLTCSTVHRKPIYVTIQNRVSGNYLWCDGKQVKMSNIWSITPLERKSLNANKRYDWKLINLKNNHFLFECLAKEGTYMSLNQSKISIDTNTNKRYQQWKLIWNLKGYNLINKFNRQALDSTKPNLIYLSKYSNKISQQWLIHQIY